MWTLLKTAPCPSCIDEPAKQKDCWWCHGTLTTRLHREDDDEKEIPFDQTGTGRLYGGNVWRRRNYTLFTLLAGVRMCIEDFEPMFPPRGEEPPGCSREYKMIVEDEGPDGHSHSWLTLTEVECAIMFACDPSQVKEAEKIGEWIKDFWQHVIERQLRPLAQKYGGAHNVRLVFFFDN
jgi:hypothetical protein